MFNEANNLTIKIHKFTCIKKVCPYETELVILKGKPDTSCITHEVHLSHNTLTKSSQDINNPNHNIATIIWFGAASAIGRPSNSKALYYNDDVYYFLSWTDILGPKHRRQNDPRRQRNGLLIHYLQKVENERHRELITQQIAEHINKRRDGIRTLNP